MAKTTHVTVSKVDGALFAGEALSLTVPAADGELTILPRHEALITPLKSGQITVRTEKGEEYIQVETGVCEISENKVTVLL